MEKIVEIKKELNKVLIEYYNSEQCKIRIFNIKRLILGYIYNEYYVDINKMIKGL